MKSGVTSEIQRLKITREELPYRAVLSNSCKELSQNEQDVFVISEHGVEEDRMKDDERTALLVTALSNTICPFIQMEVDYPSKHTSGWMPILNIQVRIAEDKSVDYKWYKKPMASPYCILNDSAMPTSMKRLAQVQQVVTMLRNTRLRLHQGMRVNLLEEMATTMWISGYSEDWRQNILESGLKCFEKQVDRSERGEVPLFRPRGWKMEERRTKKRIKKAAYFRPSDTVIRVPYTPNSELAGLVREVVEQEGRRIDLDVKVQEGAGVSLKQQLVNTDLHSGEDCPQGDCPICLSGGRGGLTHHRSGAVYSGDCLICGEEEVGETGLGGRRRTVPVAGYWGESGDSGYTRTKEHIDSIRTKNLKNAFAKHLEIYHPEDQGNTKAFKFRVNRTYRKALPRLCCESNKIYDNEAKIPMNSKSEWHAPAVERVVFTREVEEQEAGRRGRRRGGS